MRKHRWLRRGAFFLLFLLGLYLLFWWAMFNPLESGVDNLAAIVPADVSYMLHSSWGGLRSSGLWRAHLAGGTFAEGASEALDLEKSLYAPLREAEDQINASIPDFVGKFEVFKDVAGREILLAGNLTGTGDTLSDKVLNSPWLLLTRISFKTKFMEALRYGFVAEKIPNLKAFPNYYQYDIGVERLKPGAPEGARYTYFRRIRDVLILSNNRDLIEKAVHLGVAGSDKEVSRENLTDGNYWFYYDVKRPPDDPGVTVWLRVARADGELGGEIEGRDPASRGAAGELLRSFFPVGLTTSVTLHLGAEGADRVPLSGSIRMADAADAFPEWLYSFHHREGGAIKNVAEDLGAILPRSGTFGLSWFSMPGPDFLRTLTNALGEGTRDLLFGKPGTRKDGWSPAQMSTDLGGWFEDGVAVAWTRLPDVNSIDLDTWKGGDVDPLPAATFVFTRKEQLSEEALLDYFRRNFDRFGFTAAPEPLESPAGRLFQLKWAVDRKLKLLDPGMAFLDRRFLFSTNVGALRMALEAAAKKRETLGESDAYKAAVASVLPEGNLFLFVDAENLKAFLKDQRWQHAFDASTFNRQRFYNETFIKVTEEHPDWEREKIAEETERAVDRRTARAQEVDFPAAVQDYLDRMFWWEPFGSLALSTVVSGDGAGRKLQLKGAVGLTPPVEEPGR